MKERDLQPIKLKYGIIGNSHGLNRALDIATQVAPTDLSVLIEGENGVGKEVLPRIIHDHSARKHNKYFAINCGSIPEGTIDSELFGHEKGSFTGAVGESEGYFGATDKGTLFLDEVGELPLSTQVRLLRVLETGEYLRVGSSQVRHSDVRIIAATNVKMQKAIKEGRFREDLYYRLATIPIAIPPLRERGSDIELLFRKFAADIAEKYRLEPIRLTDDGLRLLESYKWPGNIRQLKNLTEQMSIICAERTISAEVLRQFGLTDDASSQGALVVQRDAKSPHSYESERDMLLNQLYNLSMEIREIKNMLTTARQADSHTAATPHTPVQIYNAPHANVAAPVATAAPVSAVGTVDAAPDDADGYEIAEPYVEERPRSIREQTEQSIIEALRRNHYNRKRTAQELGISERTIYRKIRELGLDNDNRPNP